MWLNSAVQAGAMSYMDIIHISYMDIMYINEGKGYIPELKSSTEA